MVVDPRRLRTPETDPSSSEGADGEDFDELLQGMLDLTSLEGNVSATDFIQRTLQEMEKMGVEPNDYRIGLILKHAVGSREDAMVRLVDKTSADFETTYPGVVGELIKWYVEPLLSE